MINRNSSRFTWPNPSVSRLGSSASASGSAIATVSPRGHPQRSAIGTSSTARTTPSATTETTTLIQPATWVERAAIGSMVNAANGGYV